MQFRRLICIKSMYKKFHNEKEILQKISLPTFLGKQLLSQSKNFKDEELHNIFIELANLDLRIKFDSNITPLLLQEFFQFFCIYSFNFSLNKLFIKFL